MPAPPGGGQRARGQLPGGAPGRSGGAGTPRAHAAGTPDLPGPAETRVGAERADEQAGAASALPHLGGSESQGDRLTCGPSPPRPPRPGRGAGVALAGEPRAAGGRLWGGGAWLLCFLQVKFDGRGRPKGPEEGGVWGPVGRGDAKSWGLQALRDWGGRRTGVPGGLSRRETQDPGASRRTLGKGSGKMRLVPRGPFPFAFYHPSLGFLYPWTQDNILSVTGLFPHTHLVEKSKETNLAVLACNMLGTR